MVLLLCQFDSGRLHIGQVINTLVGWDDRLEATPMGKTAVLGQIAGRMGQTQNGLPIVWDNQWTETATSGPALVGPPGSGSKGIPDFKRN